jgi:hypothetical protein
MQFDNIFFFPERSQLPAQAAIAPVSPINWTISKEIFLYIFVRIRIRILGSVTGIMDQDPTLYNTVYP